MIYSRVKRYEITSWMKEVLYMPIEGEILNTPINELELSVRATNVLANAGIITVSDFILFGPEKLCKVKNTGEKTIYEIGNAIQEILTKGKCGGRKGVFIEHQNSECLKTEYSNLTFEDQINTSFDEKLLNTPIEELNLPVRAFNGLKNAELKTIKDVIDFGLHALRVKKNIGRKTIIDIKDAILEVQKTQTDRISEISFVDAICSIISSVTPKYLPIIEARFGYYGKCKTLEEIGSEIGITRERVRQIIVKESRRIKHPKRKETLQAIIEHIERLLFKYKGILSINDIAKGSYFIGGTYKHIRFLTNLIIELYENRYRIIDKYFLTSLTDDEIKDLRSKIRDAALESNFPIDEKLFIKNLMSSVGLLSTDYLSYHLLYRQRIEISKGQVLSPGRLSIPQKVKLLIRDIDKPMHFTEITGLYRGYFGDSTAKTITLEHAIHARIGDSKDFIIVGPGTFILRDKFRVPDNIEEIVGTSKEILQNLRNISDTKYLVKELKRQNIELGDLNPYSLKTILLEYPEFIRYGKFEIGIKKLTTKYERKSLSNLIYEILRSTDKPLHAKEIWRQISKQRGFPRYAIEQRLYDEPQFIKMAPSTYTVKENIFSYEKKRKLIIDFTKEWINIKKHAVSAFFVSEVLKATEEVKDLFLGLVEHVLATSPEFIRLPNGFYDLAEK